MRRPSGPSGSGGKDSRIDAACRASSSPNLRHSVHHGTAQVVVVVIGVTSDGPNAKAVRLVGSFKERVASLDSLCVHQGVDTNPLTRKTTMKTRSAIAAVSLAVSLTLVATPASAATVHYDDPTSCYDV